MANLNGSNLMESMLETQKSIVDKMVENTKKIANGNNLVNETINKGTEWYKNWLDNQKNVANTTTTKAQEMSGTVQQNANKMNEFFQNWMNTQNNFAKQLWEMNQNWSKATMQQAGTMGQTNPMEQFNNWSNQMTNMMNSFQPHQNNWMQNPMMQNWMNGFTQNNPFSMDSMKSAADNATNLFNQYNEMLNYTFANLQKTMQGGTAQDAFRNMMNVNEGFVRFHDMWAPMWKSIQNKTFNMDMFKQMAEPAMYKEVMDKMFGFMPEHTNQYFQNLSKMIQDGLAQARQFGFANQSQMRDAMGNMMPGFNPSALFEQMLNGRSEFRNNVNSIFAPMAKMITPNQYTKKLADWTEIADLMVEYNIKNAEMQYMIYERGTKVMDNVAQAIINKIENGEEISSMMALYQEYLNMSDKEFVTLFESDEYSKIMADTASLQMKLRKDIEMQMEQSLSGIPVATRSELDELYKTIYDLKKQVRQLEKMMEMESDEETTEEVAPVAKKATARKK